MLNRRSFACAAAGAAFCQTPKSAARPNIVFVLTDDQRADCLSRNGHPFLKTPHLDRLASEGAYFNKAFCTTALCSPSRATFLSGNYSHVHGVANNFTEYPVKMQSWPGLLRAAGYRTAYIGKWHMGEENDNPRPGFDYWASHKGQGKYFDTEFNINGKRQEVKGYYTHVVTEMAKDFLSKRGKQPFAMVLGHKAPHGIWIPEKKYEHAFDNVRISKPKTAMPGPDKPAWVRERIGTWHGINGPLYGSKDYDTFIRTYHATILSVDDSIGELRTALERTGDLDNTVFIFASDSGFLLGEHGSIDKRVMWEESIRIPMMIRYPRAIRAGTRVESLVLNNDVAPTVLELCGVAAKQPMQGRSLAPLFAGKPVPNWRKSFFYEYNFEDEFPYTPNVRGVRTDRWKYIHYPNGEGQPETHKAELYDLRSDPQETRNLADAPAGKETLISLRRELMSLKKQFGAVPDRMPVNPKVRYEDPKQSIR
jgi:N-acetylglucosamine-6-sulfatase